MRPVTPFMMMPTRIVSMLTLSLVRSCAAQRLDDRRGVETAFARRERGVEQRALRLRHRNAAVRAARHLDDQPNELTLVVEPRVGRVITRQHALPLDVDRARIRRGGTQQLDE